MCHPAHGRHTVTIKSNELLAEGIYDMVLDAPRVASIAKPGQFVNLYCQDGMNLLPRPISLCEYDREEGTIRLVYAVVGKGTEAFSKLEAGQQIDVLGPLGKGFPISEQEEEHLILGGGVGVPPLLQLAKELKGSLKVVLGYRDEPFLLEDFEALAKAKGNMEVKVATDSGKVGTKGTVMNHYEETDGGAKVYSCGPSPMLKAIQTKALSLDQYGYLSLEERMGCGFGACVGCVCRIKTKDEAGQETIEHKKVCKDGPVFKLQEVDFS